VLGEVYDVTPGSGHYGSGSSYSIFAGKDSTASFVTGDFSEEGGKASLDDLPTNQLGGIESWRKFYANHAKYTFVGVLEGKFYDKDGNPTNELLKFQERLSSAKKKRGETKR